MSQALQNTKWLWCLLILYTGPMSLVDSVTEKTTPNNGPGTVEAQAKFFQDFFSVQLSPYKIEFGHVCEDPNTWEQRYEAKDFKNHRDMGKVRWGDKQGGYGEHYWDLNHAGHADNHGDDRYGGDADDGSYHEHNDDSSTHDDPYDEPSEQAPNYDTDYDPEKAVKYDENNRAKRAHIHQEEDDEDPIIDIPKTKPRKQRKQQKPKQEEYEYETAPVELKKPKHKRQQKPVVVDEGDDHDDIPEQTEKEPEHEPFVPKEPKKSFVPYEGGAGVRQHQQPSLSDYTAAASVPRLFLEPSTGHVVDRATGQAYVLQPIVNYN